MERKTSTTPRSLPVHTFLVAAAPVLAIVIHNLGQLALPEILPSLGISLLLAAVLLAAGRLVTGDGLKGGLLASLALILFFSHGHVQAALRSAHLGPPALWANRHLLPFWGLLLALAGLALVRARRRFGDLTRVLNLTAVLVVALQAGQIAVYKTRAALSYRTIPSGESAPSLADADSRRGRPDIYFIILDRYPNERTLRETFGFDNGPFLDFLRSRGFHLAGESHSNYTDTAHSLASSLNMEYLDFLEEPARLLPSDWMPLFRRIEDNRVVRLLHELDYRFIHFGSSWPATTANRHALRNVNVIGLREFDRMLWEHSAAQPLLRPLGLSDPFREKQARVARNFQELARLPEDPAPTFAFAHFLLPHPPYVFGEAGPYAQSPGRDAGEAPLFLAQLRYTNSRLRELVDALLARSSPTPIVILQGDEGPYPEGRSGPTSFLEMSAAELRDKTSILNALLLPGARPEGLHPGLSPVNTFRLVLRETFAADLELLPDKIYAFPDFRHLYEFEDVTARAGESGASENDATDWQGGR